MFALGPSSRGGGYVWRLVRLRFRFAMKARRTGFPPASWIARPLLNLVGRKRLRMLCENKTRFKKTEDALRFYFRLRELLHSGRARRLVADELPAAACLRASNAIDDYQCIGWCMQGLGEIDLWLLSEVYGPTCFGVHRRTFSHACKAGRLEFPNREFRLRQVGLIHRHAIGMVSRRLRALCMIPSARMTPVAQARRRLRASLKRVRVHGAHAANQ